MRPKNRNKRLGFIALGAVLLGTGALLLLSALRESTQFFYNPSEVASKNFVPRSQIFRIGGLVVENSIEQTDAFTIAFRISDFPEDIGADVLPAIIPVSYTGIVPDLFKEGKGVVVSGKLLPSGQFIADEVLAKHDENYQPKKNY
ncbi:MAG: cytochrome c maturation protein CcmE [Hyphomonadaceae bacterium]|nr:cytochrome c maturation protein CcmE [Hyphomonadaceae bacterium]